MKVTLVIMMMFFMFVLSTNAQISTTVKDTSKIYTHADTAPQYPGGFVMFERYIDNTLAKLLKPGHATGTVFADVVMEKNGQISQVKIINGLTPAADSLAVYLLKNSPAWKPAYNSGQPVRAIGRLGVTFKKPDDLQPVHTPAVASGNYAYVTIDDPNKIFTSVEKYPEFPGGYDKFYQYLKDNRKITVPIGVNPDRVIVTFVVEKDGSLTDIKVVKSISAGCDAEAIRLIKSSPKWLPGMVNGTPVRVLVPIPVSFKAGS